MRRYVAFIFWWLISFLCYGQSPLDQPITISFYQEHIADVLVKLSDHSSSQLAFSPDILNNKIITSNYEEVPLNDVLFDLLGKGYEFKIRGSYVIIVHSPQKEKKVITNIGGSVKDAETGEALPDASIYEVSSLTATLTSSDGSFDLTTKTLGRPTLYAISRENYRDTIISVNPSLKERINIILNPSKEEAEKVRLIDRIGITKLLVSDKTQKHTQNVDLTEKSFIQMSLVPGISTNGFLGGEVNNNLSLNLIGGYVHSVHGLEMGGAFNLVRLDFAGLQTAGAVNIVGDNFHGAQMAGAVNLTLKDFKGTQLAGAVNVVNGYVRGLQMAGAYNQSWDMEGAQMAGAINVAKNFKGLQMASAVNLSTGNFNGVQVSGAVNISENMKGFQASGALNIASGTVSGLQIAGAVNYAKKLSGIQIGVVNVAGEVDRGMMIGILNLTKNGMLAFDLGHNDVTDFTLDFRSGTKRFYSILSAGISPHKELWTSGLGIGSQLSINEKTFTAFELSSHTIRSTDMKFEEAPADHRFNVSLGYEFTNRIAIHGGPVLHFSHYKRGSTDATEIFNSIGEKPFSSPSDNQKWWIGYRLALRL